MDCLRFPGEPRYSSCPSKQNTCVQRSCSLLHFIMARWTISALNSCLCLCELPSLIDLAQISIPNSLRVPHHLQDNPNLLWMSPKMLGDQVDMYLSSCLLAPISLLTISDALFVILSYVPLTQVPMPQLECYSSDKSSCLFQMPSADLTRLLCGENLCSVSLAHRTQYVSATYFD